MQKRWKMLITLVLALMMLVTSVCAENESAGEPEGSTEAPVVTVVPSTSTGDSTATPVATVTAEPTTVPTATATAEPTTVPTATATAAPATAVPTATATAAPATAEPTVDVPQAPAATATPQPSEAPETEPSDEVEINPDAAAEAEEAAQPTPVVPVTPVSTRRGTWVALNISMRNLTDDRASASMKMAQFLLARSVADGVPVGVYFQREKNKGSEIFNGAVTSAEEWAELMEKLADSDFNSSEEGRTDFKFFMQTINGMDLRDVDVWVLATKPKSTANLEWIQNTERILNESGMTMHFLSFQKQGELLSGKEKWWLHEQILALDAANFEYDILDYQSVADNPIPMAMELFGLNLLAPYTERHTDDNGDTIWQHAGMDTLLVLTTESGGVSVVADAVKGADRAFPIVMKMSDTQYMVLLRNVTPGTYRIIGKVTNLKAAYNIQDATLTLENAPADGAQLSWYLEQQELVVKMDLPQVRDPKDVSLKVFINDVETAVAQVAVPSENGIQWTVTVPRQILGPGNIRFVASTGDTTVEDFVVESPAYSFVVVDRSLQLSGSARAEYFYYYNVPGEEDMPVSVELAQYFHNPDEQTLEYQYAPGEFTIENDVLTYQRGENTLNREWPLRVTDGVSPYVEFTVGMKHVDFLAEVQGWQAQMAQTAFEGTLGQDTEIAFTLSAEAVQTYADVRKQYPQLPEKLEEALQVYAMLTDGRYPEGYEIQVTFTAQEDGSLVGALMVPAYYTKEDNARLTFDVVLLNQTIEAQTIIPECTITVINDSPKVAENVSQTMVVKAGIQGAPGKRTPLTFSAINAAQKEGAAMLPSPFVPEALFADLVHLEGLTVTIKAEPAALVKLVRLDTDETTGEMVETEVAPQAEGMWVLDPAASKLVYELQILDKGTVTLSISAHDGENAGEQEISWTFKVSSPFDTTVLIVSIAAVLLAIAAIVLLILRQIHKPSFARMNSVAYVCVCTNYSPNPAYVEAPMSIYGKKETDLAHLVIACQQPPVRSMPIDVLADVAIQPGKRRSFRLVLGKRAENLNVVVGDQAQNPQKPVVFGQDQLVRVYADMNEMLFLQITSGR